MPMNIGRTIGLRRTSPTLDLEAGPPPQDIASHPQSLPTQPPRPAASFCQALGQNMQSMYIGTFPAGADLPRLPIRRVLQQPQRLIDSILIGATTGAWCALLGAALGRSHAPMASTGHAALLGAALAGARHVADAHFLQHIRTEAGLRAAGSATTLIQSFRLGILVGAVNTFHRVLISLAVQNALQRHVPSNAGAMQLTTTTGEPEGTYTGLFLDIVAVAYAPFVEEIFNRHMLLRGWFALRRTAYEADADVAVAFMSDARILHLAAGLGFGLLHVLNDHTGATVQGIETGVLSSPAYLQLYTAGGYGTSGVAASAGAHFFHNSVATVAKHLGL